MLKRRWPGLAAALMLAAGLASAEVSVPLTIEKAIPVTQLTINGATFPFTFDTGSRQTVHLRPEVMAAIPGLRLTGRKRKSFDLAGKVQESDEFVIPDLVINGVSFGEVTGESYAAWGLNIGPDAGPPPASVFGLGLFARQPFIYDYSAQTLRFGAPLKTGEGWQALPYVLTDEGIVASFGNQRTSYRMGLDSAASISIIKRKTAFGRKDDTASCDMFGPGKQCDYVAVGLGGGPQFNPFLMDLPEQFTADGIAGSDFFQHYAVYVDLANRQVQLRPSASGNK
jgi:hypothetical protein